MIARLDELIYAAERRVVGVLMMLMGFVMFADVVHRVYSRSPGRLAEMLSSLSGRPAVELDATVSPLVILALVWFVAFAAIRARGHAQGSQAVPVPRALALAALTTAVLSATVQAFVRLRPEGVVWAPYFSLCCLLWSGLIGASMATYNQRHLALEMGEKIWPEALRPGVRRVAQLVTAAFCVFITVLGSISFADHLSLWLESPTANLIPSVDIPKWAVFWVIPYAFGVMSLRLVGRAIGLLPAREAANEFELPPAPPASDGASS